MKRTRIARSPLHCSYPLIGLIAGGTLGWLINRNLWDLGILWLAVLAIVTFAVFGLDKHRAQRGIRRIPEATLLLWTALGGTLGAILAMSILRHKTQKPAFQRPLWLIIGCQIIGMIVVSVLLS